MLKSEIGFNAGYIMELLMTNSKLTFRQIEELTNYRDVFILMAIGWLLRENKIIAIMGDDGTLFFELSSVISEIYY